MAEIVAVWHWVCGILRWLFVDECSTATSLLSLSFSVNSVFAGLSLSRFDLCGGLRKKAVECIDGIADGNIVERIELLGKNTPSLNREFVNFVNNADNCKAALQTGLSIWEKSRLWVTICCAGAAFFMIAFEVRTRIGFVLVLPYFIVLLFHFRFVWKQVKPLRKGYNDLIKAMGDAELNARNGFDAADYVKRLKADLETISSGNDTKKQKTPRAQS